VSLIDDVFKRKLRLGDGRGCSDRGGNNLLRVNAQWAQNVKRDYASLSKTFVKSFDAKLLTVVFVDDIAMLHGLRVTRAVVVPPLQSFDRRREHKRERGVRNTIIIKNHTTTYKTVYNNVINCYCIVLGEWW